VKISQALLDEMIEHARAEAPDECCGMVSARDDVAVAVHRMRNATPSPLRYTMDPMDQYRVEMGIDDDGLDLGAIYHSHTRSAPLPSQTDINLAAHPHAIYIIVGLAGDEPDVRAWRIADGEVSEAELVVG
jgi:proteasome lid subunit RPN8/RPN11